jgi:hypothetical protein
MSDQKWSGVPVAWAAVAPNGQPMWLGYDRPIGGRTVPLYRHAQPTLTDAEREAIAWVLGDVADITGRRKTRCAGCWSGRNENRP